MSKVRIVVCTGTTCYVMGAGNLLAIKEYLGKEIADKVEIEGSICLGLCKNDQFSGAPYVKVNDTVIPQATMTKIADEIRKNIS